MRSKGALPTVASWQVLGHVDILWGKYVVPLSPYSSKRRVCVGYPTRMKLMRKTRNVHGQCKPQRKGTQHNLYSTCSRWVCGASSWVSLVRKALQIPTYWYRQRKPLALGAVPNAKTQHEWFHIAVEYRLYSTYIYIYISCLKYLKTFISF